MNPFSENFILKGVIDLLSYINPFSENFILRDIISGVRFIADILNPLSENWFVSKMILSFISALTDLFEFLFIPQVDSYNQITNVFKEKLGFIDSIKIYIDSIQSIIFNNIDTAVSIDYDVDTDIYKGTLSIDFGWFEKFKPYTDVFLTGFVYLFFVWRLFVRLPSIINGLEGKWEVDE